MDDPLHCSIFVLYQSTPEPYRIADQDDAHDDDNINPPYISVLKAVFGQVVIHSSTTAILEQIAKQTCPSLCLVDVDDCIMDNDKDAALARIRHLTRDLEEMADELVPVIACSVAEDTKFMLKCMDAGAIDYLLKPLRIDVVKTLFLKLYRIQADHINTRMRALDMASSPATTTISTITPITPTSSSVNQCTSLHHRLQDMTAKDAALEKAIIDIYLPNFPRKSTLTPLSSQRAEYLERRIASWDFCPFDFDHDELVHCAYLILDKALSWSKMAHITIKKEQLYDFILDLSGSYHHGNPYHNFAHAVDVLQCIYYFLCKLGIFSNDKDDRLQPSDVLALLIAALGHDAGHPGVNNGFMINSGTPLAILYNDRSVLESFHSMTLFHILKKHGIDECFGGFRSPSYQAFRKTVVASILATDMSLHDKYVKKIKEHAARSCNENLDIEEDRLLFCSALIKCADISNVTRPFERSAKWAELLVEEFTCQGDLERQLGMAVQPMNDRDKLVLEDMQIGFIKFVASSLFEGVASIAHELTFTVEYIQSNLKSWESRKQWTSNNEKNKTDVVAEKSDPNCHVVALHHQQKSIAITRNDGKTDKMFLPQMPAVAMTSYYTSNTTRTDQDGMIPDWSGPSAQGGVYCQCAIM